MAITFQSPRKKQRIILNAVAAVFILVLFLVSLAVFPPQLQNGVGIILPNSSSAPVLEAQRPDIQINFAVIDSNYVKSLQPFPGVKMQFDYIALNGSGNQVKGKILSASEDDAKASLKKEGFKILSLEEDGVGNKQPFAPYYQTAEKL